MRECLPLAPRPEHVEYAVHGLPAVHPRPASLGLLLVRRDERLDPLPERVWDLVQRVYAETFFDRRLQLTVIEDAETTRRLYHAVRTGSHQVVNDSGLFFGLALSKKDSPKSKDEQSTL